MKRKIVLAMWILNILASNLIQGSEENAAIIEIDSSDSFSMVAQDSAETWESYQQRALNRLISIPGWCSQEKARVIMDLIKDHPMQTCVEIGVFGGSSLFPIAKALHYNGTGIVWGIDAWDSKIAISGMDPDLQRADLMWWSAQDYDALYLQTEKLINDEDLQNSCRLLRIPAEIAINLFDDESIDFIHFDGNHASEYVLKEISAYFPKIKDGGYILLNDPFWLSLRSTLVFLLERTEPLTRIHPSMSYILFRKTSERLEKVSDLFISETGNT